MSYFSQYILPAATGAVLGGVIVGANITNTSGTISLTGANVTAALGYTPLSAANNLSDLANAATARTNLGAGAANGLATLDATSKIPVAQIPSSVVGALNYQGAWNASTNSPALASGVGTKGFYYKVSTTGATTIDGVSQWNTGDLISFDGTTWDKIDGLASEVLSVAGRTGAVVLANTDVSGLGTLSTQAAGAVAITGGTVTNVRQQGHVTILTAAGNYTGVTADFGGLIVINKTTGAATAVTLPASPVAGDMVTVKDGKGDCATNNITLTAAAGNIDGAASFVMNQAWCAIDLVYNGTLWNIV